MLIKSNSLSFFRLKPHSSLSAKAQGTRRTLTIMKRKHSGSPQQKNARKNLMISKLHTHTESKRLLLSYISGEKIRGFARHCANEKSAPKNIA